MISRLTHRQKAVLKRIARSMLRVRILWLPFAYTFRLRGLLGSLHEGVKKNWADGRNHYDLRRNVHRLEKGLSFPKRRSVFAEDYIGETVALLARGRKDPSCDEATLNWAGAVLECYFDAVEHTPTVAKAHRSYSEARLSPADPGMVPYPSHMRPESPVTFEALHTLARRRRSVRFYRDEPVEVDVVRRALGVAAEAPSSCNRQAFRYLYFDQPDMVDRLAQVPGGIAGYRVPSLIVVIGRYRAYFDERDLKAPIVDASLSVMSFILALETLGVSSVCINWPNHPRRERRIRELIELERDEFVVMMIGLGYADPDGLVPFSAKLPDDHMLSVNERIKHR